MSFCSDFVLGPLSPFIQGTRNAKARCINSICQAPLKLDIPASRNHSPFACFELLTIDQTYFFRDKYLNVRC